MKLSDLPTTTAFTASRLVTLASYKFPEAPLLRLKNRFQRRRAAEAGAGLHGLCGLKSGC